MYCVNCGKKLPEEGQFCPYCGTARASSPSAEPKPEPTKTPTKTKPSKEKPASLKASLLSRAKKLPKPALFALGLAALIVVVILTLVLINAIQVSQKAKCPDPFTFFSLSAKDEENYTVCVGNSHYTFNQTYPANMDPETAWDALEEYEELLEKSGADVSLENETDNPYHRYKLEADFGQTSLFDNSHRRLTVIYYPPEERWFFNYWESDLKFVPAGTYSDTASAGTGTTGPLVSESAPETFGSKEDPAFSRASAPLPDPTSFFSVEPEWDEANDSFGEAWWCNYEMTFHEGWTAAHEYAEQLLCNPVYGLVMRERSEEDTWITSGTRHDVYFFDYVGDADVNEVMGDYTSSGRPILTYTADVFVYIKSMNFPVGSERSTITIKYSPDFTRVDSGRKATGAGRLEFIEPEPDEDSGSSSGNSSSGSSSSSSDSKHPCSICRRTGDCQTCGGDGYLWSSANDKENRNCYKCRNHNGKCTYCNGTGWTD